MYRHLYSDFAFSLFHISQPLPSTVKNGLSRPFTTTASVFFCWAMAGSVIGEREQPRRWRARAQLLHAVSSRVVRGLG